MPRNDESNHCLQERVSLGACFGDLYMARTDSGDVEKATNYDKTLIGFKELDNVNARCKFGGGGLVSSARNLAQMGAALYQGDIVDSDALATLLQPSQTNDGEEVAYAFGMGVGVKESFQPPSHYAAHSGGSPGGRSYLLVLFEPRIAVGMSTNFDGPNLGKVAEELASMFAGASD